MSRKERSRLEVMARVRDGQITLAKAAELLGISRRQAYRLNRRYQEDGDAGLVHRLRGRAGNRGATCSLRQAVLKVYREKYADFGPTLAAEYLEKERPPVSVDHETLRRWLLSAGLWSRRRGRSKHRSRRQRRECLGEMVQMDGSHHDWFEGRRAWAVLMVMIDDATGRTFARFFEGETTCAAFEVFGAYAARHGLPRSLYVDRDSIYRSDRQSTVQEELKAESPLTQFGRAMKQLEVELILANSPQAKGRVERMNGTLQDRLVKALRVERISTIESANAYLSRTFLPALNRKFCVKAASGADLHRKVQTGVKLGEVLCFEEQRVVQSDWCVAWRNRVFQLDRRHEALGLVRRNVVVREKLNGAIQLLSQGHALHWRELKARPRPEQRGGKAVVNNRRWIPAAAHPWRGVPRVNPAPAAPARDLHAERIQGQRVTVLLS